jgi:hypothetical protein
VSEVGARLAPMGRQAHPDFSTWIVTCGDPSPAVMLPRPRRAVARARTYGGGAVHLEVDVVARARGFVCVRQELAGRDPWFAWLPAAQVRPVTSGSPPRELRTGR